MRVLHVASEVTPWAQTGGLGDVVAALPPALRALGADAPEAFTLAPLYARARLALPDLTLRTRGQLVFGRHRLDAALCVSPAAPHVGWLDVPPLFDRPGIYGPDGRSAYGDNHVRFAALAIAALELGPALCGGPIDVVHGHDWQGSLAVYLARQRGVASVLTIHNLAFRGLFPKSAVDELGIPWSDFVPSRVEFYDQLCLLKAGITAADVVTTVSPRYAQEILTPPADEGLGGTLRHDARRLIGILNCIDTASWDPARDAALPASFSAADVRGRAACRAAILREFGLAARPDVPLAAVVSRMSSQKGTDLIAEIAPSLPTLGVQLLVLGNGDPDLEHRLRELAAAHPDWLGVRIGFDLGLSRRVYAGAELFLMPSRFEPCGLGQLYAMRYGAVPVVRAVGGLADTVRDGDDDDATGFVFEHADAGAVRWALGRARQEWRDDPGRFARRQQAGMRRDSAWTRSAAAYRGEYRRVLGQAV